MDALRCIKTIIERFGRTMALFADKPSATDEQILGS